MQSNEQDLGNVCRTGFCLGLVAFLGGLLIGAVQLARPEGFGTFPSIAADALHLQARVQLFGGCLVLALANLWGITRPRGAGNDGLRRLLVATILISSVSAGLAVLLNWAIVTGHVADHLGLLPAVLDLLAALLYALTAASLLSSAESSLAVDALVHGGAVWLVLYAAAQLTWTAGRVFLDNDRLLWFVDAPAMEAGLLGFLAPTGFGLLLKGLPDVAHNRGMLRTVPQVFQAAHLCLALWLWLRIWCLRYPGSYQRLVFALTGLGILVCILKIVTDSGLLKSLRRAPPVSRGKGAVVGVLPASLAFLVVSAMLFASAAIYAAGASSAPPRPLFGGLTLALTLGFFAILAFGLLTAAHAAPAEPPAGYRLVMAACWFLAGGTALSILLRAMATVVERSLNAYTVGADGIAVVGLVMLALWACGSVMKGYEDVPA